MYLFKSQNSLIIRCIALRSTNRAPVQFQLPVQQICVSSKREKRAGEETFRLELVRGARGSRAPQTNTHVNGDALSVFDDGTLSEVSDDEGRYTCSMPLLNILSLSLTCKACSDWMQNDLLQETFSTSHNGCTKGRLKKSRKRDTI